MKNPPAFQFYPNDFISDRKVAAMSMEERGIYMTLLCYCWQDGELPDDMTELADMCGMDSEHFTDLWDRRIGRCFERADSGQWINPRMKREMEKQAEYRKHQSISGKMGAKKRWENSSDNGETIATPFAENSDPITSPIAKNGSSSSSSSSSTSTDKSKSVNAYSVSFEKFWKAYPDSRRTGKGAAYRVWQRDKLESKLEQIIQKIEQYKFTEQWKKEGGQFIPHPSTFLNQKRYDDEPKVQSSGRNLG